jgi:hypothetical protein
MANYNGKTAVFVFGGTTIDITNFTVSTSKPTQNVSDSGSGDNEEWSSVGRKSWTVSFDAFLKAGEDPPDEGDSGTFTGTLNTGKDVTGTAIVESLEITVPAGSAEDVTYSGTLRGTGALTKPTF